MIIYILMLAFFGIVASDGVLHRNPPVNILPFNKRISQKNWQIILFTIAMFLVMALRDKTVGNDIQQYLYHYNDLIPNTSWTETFQRDEPAFYVFGKILQILHTSDQMFIAIVAAILCVSFACFFAWFSPDAFWSYYIHVTYGLFAMSLTGVRQSLAVACVIFATKFAVDRKLFPFIIMCLLAYFFHNSAVVAIIIWLLPKIKVDRKKAVMIFFAVCSLLILRTPFGYAIAYFLPERYTSNRYTLFSDQYSVNPMLIVIAILILSVVCIFWNECREVPYFSMLYLGTSIYVAFTILSMNFNLIGRLTYYYVFFTVSLISALMTSIKNRNTRIIADVAMIILPLVMFLKGQSGGSLRIDHYKFFFM